MLPSFGRRVPVTIRRFRSGASLSVGGTLDYGEGVQGVLSSIRCVDVCIVRASAVATGELGSVESMIRSEYQFERGQSILGESGDADADGYVHRLARVGGGRGEGMGFYLESDPLSHVDSLFPGRGDVRQVLLAPIARGPVGAPNNLLDD